MTFEKGSLIFIEYDARLKDGGQLIETTSEEHARVDSIYDPEAPYMPKLVSIGAPNFPILGALQEELSAMSVGESRTVEVEPEKAWGVRDPKKVRMYSQRKLGKDADNYSVGDTVKIDDKEGVIRFIGSGRMQIDFNHVYAGKTITYNITVARHLEGRDDIIRGILEYTLGLKDTGFAIGPDTVTIDVPQLAGAANLQAAHKAIARNIFEFAPDVQNIQFVETYANTTQPKFTVAGSGGGVGAGASAGVGAGTGSVYGDDDDDYDDDDDDLDLDDDDLDDLDDDDDDDDNDDDDLDDLDDDDDDNDDDDLDDLDDNDDDDDDDLDDDDDDDDDLDDDGDDDDNNNTAGQRP